MPSPTDHHEEGQSALFAVSEEGEGNLRVTLTPYGFLLTEQYYDGCWNLLSNLRAPKAALLAQSSATAIEERKDA